MFINYIHRSSFHLMCSFSWIVLIMTEERRTLSFLIALQPDFDASDSDATAIQADSFATAPLTLWLTSCGMEVTTSYTLTIANIFSNQGCQLQRNNNYISNDSFYF